MTENRNGKDRRVTPDRRKSGGSAHDGPEKRAIKYRRSEKDRREKDSD